MIRTRHLLGFLAATCAVVGLFWAWSAFGQRTYKAMDFTIWAVKKDMISSCQLSDTLVLGDSRATAGLIPAVLAANGPVTNLALPGGTPIEAAIQLERILQCPNRPKRLILSFSPQQFSETRLFWTHTFDFFTWDELQQVRSVEARNGRFEVHDGDPLSLLTDAVRDWAFSHRFPSFDFGLIVHANWSRRRETSKLGRAETISAGGYHIIGDAACTSDLGWETTQQDFDVSQLYSVYFNRLLDEATRHSMRLLWISMPFSETTDAKVTPAFRNRFMAYMQRELQSHPQVQVVGDLWPVMGRCRFGDASHLNAAGAADFSRRVAAMLPD